MAPLVEQLLQAHQSGSAPRSRRLPARSDRQANAQADSKSGTRPRVMTARLSNWQSSFAEKFQPRDFRKDDLRPFYHLNLKEAAGKLGICATTLKRVCRRLGVRKWPRRALAKLSQQKVSGAESEQSDEMELPPSPHLHTAGSGSGSSEATMIFKANPSLPETPSPMADHKGDDFSGPGRFTSSRQLVPGSTHSSPESFRDARDACLNPPAHSHIGADLDLGTAFGMDDWELDPTPPLQQFRPAQPTLTHSLQHPGGYPLPHIQPTPPTGQFCRAADMQGSASHVSDLSSNLDDDINGLSPSITALSKRGVMQTGMQPSEQPFAGEADWNLLQQLLDCPGGVSTHLPPPANGPQIASAEAAFVPAMWRVDADTPSTGPISSHFAGEGSLPMYPPAYLQMGGPAHNHLQGGQTGPHFAPGKYEQQADMETLFGMAEMMVPMPDPEFCVPQTGAVPVFSHMGFPHILRGRVLGPDEY